MITKDNKVSVIITTYKRAKMLNRAVNSVLNQTYSNIEVIVVDDNDENTDYRKKTEDLMNQYKKDNRVKYIKHKVNMNGAAARNTGIKNSTGEVICFLDDDDWYLPNKIEKQLKYLVSNKQFKAVYCGWNREGRIMVPSKEGNLSFEILSGKGLIYTNTIMIWRDIAISFGGWDERFKRNQEAVFLLRFFNSGYKIGVVKECLVEFDTSDRSNVLDPKKNEDQFRFFLQEHEELIKQCKIKNAKKIIYSLRYRGIMFNYIKNRQLKKAMKIYIDMMKYIPFMFNKDIIKFILIKIFNKEIYEF